MEKLQEAPESYSPERVKGGLSEGPCFSALDACSEPRARHRPLQVLRDTPRRVYAGFTLSARICPKGHMRLSNFASITDFSIAREIEEL